jgi:hypothetical protein
MSLGVRVVEFVDRRAALAEAVLFETPPSRGV